MSPAWSLTLPVLQDNRGDLQRLVAWSALEAMPVLLSGQLIALALDWGFLAGEFLTGLGLLGVYGISMVLGALGVRYAMAPTANIVESLRDSLVRAIVTTSLRTAAHRDNVVDAGSVARITRQSEAVRQMVAALLLTTRGVVFSVIAVLAGMMTLVAELAWITAGALGICSVFLTLLSRVLRRRHRASLTAEEDLTKHCGKALAGLRDITACGAQMTAERQSGRAIDTHANALMATATIGSGRIGVIAVGARLPLLAALLAAPWLIQSGSATPGEILGAATYMIAGLEPALRSMVQTIGNVGLQLAVLLEKIADYTGHPTAQKASTGSGLTADTYNVTLREVTFRYGPHSAPVIDQLDLDIEHGDHLAIVGQSGIGKSTLANLISGQDVAQQGKITIGGVLVSELDARWLHRVVALVPQESYVFGGTLRENLVYLAQDIDERSLDEAVDNLGLRALVDRLGGYDAQLGNVDTLSQGDRQLITLARVYVSQAEVVILDEATCHLDAAAEERIEQAFASRGSTLIVVAHRITSAIRARTVLVLDGTNARIGNHTTLLETSSLYSDLAGHWTR